MEPVYIANPDVVFRREDDEAILFNPDSGDVKLLNRTGVLIYRLLDGEKSLAEIAKLIAKEYDGADPDEVRRDIDEFVEAMVACDFIYTVK